MRQVKSLRRVLSVVSSPIPFYPAVDPQGGVERGSVGQYQANGGGNKGTKEKRTTGVFAARSPQPEVHSLC